VADDVEGKLAAGRFHGEESRPSEHAEGIRNGKASVRPLD
jgi:hypothetical protein